MNSRIEDGSEAPDWDWDWYDQRFLDELTRFHERNEGHQRNVERVNRQVHGRQGERMAFDEVKKVIQELTCQLEVGLGARKRDHTLKVNPGSRPKTGIKRGMGRGARKALRQQELLRSTGRDPEVIQRDIRVAMDLYSHEDAPEHLDTSGSTVSGFHELDRAASPESDAPSALSTTRSEPLGLRGIADLLDPPRPSTANKSRPLLEDEASEESGIDVAQRPGGSGTEADPPPGQKKGKGRGKGRGRKK